MAAFLFVQKFENGSPVAMPYQALMDVLGRYGTAGRGRGDMEVAFASDTIAADCTVIGDADSGAICVGFARPNYDADLRRLVWECMERFGCAVFDDAVEMVCATLGGISALPANLAEACTNGVRQISSAEQLWPGEFETRIQEAERPALIYTNANPDGPNYQLFDYAAFEKKELYIELAILPEACNPGTLRVVRNLELRVDAALARNTEFAVFYRYANHESPLLVMESPQIHARMTRATIISPPPPGLEAPVIKRTFVSDREVFGSEQIQAAKLPEQAKEKYQIELDGGIASIDKLDQLLDKLHEAYLQERSAQSSVDPSSGPFASKIATEWAITAGAYLGNAIRQHVGAQWGYVKLRKHRLIAARTHTGRICKPHHLALDHIINGPQSSVATYFQQLRKSDTSAVPRDEDIVSNIPGYCQILVGASKFIGSDGSGLPLDEHIPRDKLDFSVDSLRELDSYLSQVARRRTSFSSQSLSNLTLAAGAYLGEVIRSKTAEPGTWLWATYDDLAREQPEFAQKRPREYCFLAVLDSHDQVAYPLGYVTAILSGVDVASTHAYARQLVGSGIGSQDSGIALASIDIQQCVRSLPADQRTYPNIAAPAWVALDPFAKLFKSFATLLEHGKPVWAQMVQANTGIFETGDVGLPGEIVYDPQGILSPEELAPIAGNLFGLRKRQAELNPSDPGQAALLAIAEHLNAETTRAFGMSVPQQLSAQPLLLSSVFFERKHLPGEKLVLPYFPVLISERCPGCAMLLPGRWWPQALLDRVEKRLDEKRFAAWDAAWQKLAAGRTAEEEEYFRCRVEALTKYARSGEDGQRAVDLVQLGMIPFRADTEPPPFEWEWDIPGQLQSYGESLLSEVETDRARGLPLNAPRARQSFIARYFAQMIALHRLLLCPVRGVSNTRLKIDPDEIQYAALGLAAGCEDAALKSARMLCLAWQRPGMYTDFVRPEVRATFVLFAAHLGLQIPALKPFKATPHLDALIENDRWRIADGDDLRILLEAACEEHTRSAPTGPFQGLPAAILLVFKLRMMAGLANPPLTHPLFAKPLALPDKETLGAVCGDLLASVHNRMTSNGFREDMIEQAMVTQSPLVVHSRAGALPLRPDLYQPRFQIVRSEAKSAEPTENGSHAGFNWIALIGMLVCFALARVGIGFFDGTRNRLLLAVLAIGVVALGVMALAYAVMMFRSLFHGKH